MTDERRWEDIGNEAIRAAGAIKCSPDEYRSGLREIVELIEVEIAASEEMDS